MLEEKSSIEIMFEERERSKRINHNIQVAQKLHTEINNMRTLGGIDNTRIELELKIMQHYFAFSDFTVSFDEWVKTYLRHIL